jgi:mono/diheme cytochrome c family protein
VFNAKSCVACHSQGGVGGGGPQTHNIRNYAVLPNRRDAEFREGTVHHFATEPRFRESVELVRRRYPVIKGGRQTVNSDGCSYTVVVADLDPVRVQALQPTALFGAGWIDRISPKAITASLMGQAVVNVAKEFKLDFSAVPPGRVRVLPDGRVGKFGWKAQFATLEEFVAAACANELGLGTPLREQVAPLNDGGYAAPASDLDRKQFKALVAFVDTLPCPAEATSDDPRLADQAARGKELFTAVGCAVCHVPDLGGVSGVYSDLLLHTIEDPTLLGGPGYGQQAPPEVPLPEELPKESEWRTPPLWGVADSAPYLHDGRAPTLRDAILRHGGDANVVTSAFKKLSREDQEAVIAFLKTLKAPPDALQPSNVAAVALNAQR